MVKRVVSLYLDDRLLAGVPEGERSSWVTFALCRMGLDFCDYMEKKGGRK